MWRLVTAKVATLTEIDGNWSIDDIYDANAVLDFQQAAANQANQGS